jgi:hypothetical protein
MGNTKPIGVAYSDQDISGADTISATLISGVDIYATDEIGYTAAAQGTVTQLTNKGTAVTLNKSAGQITMAASTIPANDVATFTLNNSLISAKDTMIVNVGSGATTAGQYTTYVTSLTSGAAIIAVRNLVGTTSPGDTLVLNYSVIHCL